MLMLMIYTNVIILFQFYKAEEESMCVYKFYVKTKLLCNPYEIMKNKIKMGVSKTRCIINNDNFNKSSSDIFNINFK